MSWPLSFPPSTGFPDLSTKEKRGPGLFGRTPRGSTIFHCRLAGRQDIGAQLFVLLPGERNPGRLSGQDGLPAFRRPFLRCEQAVAGPAFAEEIGPPPAQLRRQGIFSRRRCLTGWVWRRAGETACPAQEEEKQAGENGAEEKWRVHGRSFAAVRTASRGRG